MRFSTAIGVSVALHGVLAAGIIAVMKYASGPVVLATLDLSSVELSFAEEESESSAASPVPPEPPPEPPPPPELRAPDLERPDDPLPPDPDAPVLPEPEPERERMETPPLPREEPPAPREERPRVESPPPAPSAPAPRQARVDAPPSPRRAIRPDYPKGARQRGEQGDVVLELRVGADGAVERVEVVSSSGFSELDEAAVRAARAARFTPARSGSASVASSARLTLTFRLR